MELVALARNPVPSGATSGAFKGYDGAPLRYAWWDATQTPRRGTVCCFTGRNESIEKYFEVIADLRRRGFSVAIMDWRGQGGSYRVLRNKRKAHIKDFSEYDEDLGCFMRQIVLPDCPPPYIALAHSMGGNILIRNASSPGSWFERMVLTSPMLEIHRDQLGMPQTLAWTTSELATAVGMGSAYVWGGTDFIPEPLSFEANEVTTNRERYMRNVAIVETRPELSVGSPTYSWMRAAFRSCRWITSPPYALEVRVPILMFVAGRDTVISQRAVEDFAAKLKVGSNVLLPLAKHEILQELDEVRARFWAALDVELVVVENALKSVLRDHEAPTWLYQAARDYAERYDPRYGTGLIPSSAPMVQEIADFWRESTVSMADRPTFEAPWHASHGVRHDILGHRYRSPSRSSRRDAEMVADEKAGGEMSAQSAITRLLVYHVASGHAFFTGAACLIVAVCLPPFTRGRGIRIIRNVLVLIGGTAVFVSATPLPPWAYLGLVLLTLLWLAGEAARGRLPARFPLGLRMISALCWSAAVLVELPYHRMPRVPPLGHPTLGVIGDSVTARVLGV